MQYIIILQLKCYCYTGVSNS